MSAASPSPAARLPQEVIDMIISHLIHDTHSLLTCSITSRSWRVAAFPHLHRHLETHTSTFWDKKTEWPRPLQRASKVGWLPFITRLFIRGDQCISGEFSPNLFDHKTQHEFSTLTGVRELYIANLDIPSFISTIQQYFGQFSPTVRSLTLIRPRGTHRQIVFFIGLFQHLRDLELHLDRYHHTRESWGDPAPVPPFVPPLRGRLIASQIWGDGLAEAMIDLFGGVRFRRMDLGGTDATQGLVYACANALEELWLDATELCGEKYCLKD